MNEKLLSSYFRSHLKEKKTDFIEQVPYRKKWIDFVTFEEGGKIYSFELKVSDWKSVFNQACKNLLFSDQSYICLWYTFENRIDMDLVRKYNLGLFLIKKNEVLEIISPHNNNKYLKPNYYKSFKKKILNSLSNENIFGNWFF